MEIEAHDKAGQSVAEPIAAQLSRFDPSVAELIVACRDVIRRRFPTAIEQIYDNYNFYVMGFCTTERTSDCIVSLAASAKGLALSFYNGASLADPDGLLMGEGKQNRFIRLPAADTLLDPRVERLLAAAAGQAGHPLPTSGGGYTMLKSVSAKQRPRRKSEAPGA